ncbi:DsbA family protein [Candidatus Daviesbacteria bacterium]|nr:DsbA family protein [Candidatus Daviesbacteria bacterium]
MKQSTSFLTTPMAILLGSMVISVAVLMNGGIIKIGKPTIAPQAAQPVQASAQPQPQAPAVTLDTIKDLFSNNKNLILGDKNAKNLLVEVADPSCPFCHIAAGLNPALNKQSGPRFTLVADGGTYVAPVPEMKKLVDAGRAALVYIYTPGHGNGEMGTKAMYCSNEKGKFWPVHDKLMTSEGYDLLNNTVKNDKSKSQELANFLSEVFNAADMKACLDSGKYDAKLPEDTQTAQKLGVNGTPGFFINTTNFAGAYSWKDMESAVK